MFPAVPLCEDYQGTLLSTNSDHQYIKVSPSPCTARSMAVYVGFDKKMFCYSLFENFMAMFCWRTLVMTGRIQLFKIICHCLSQLQNFLYFTCERKPF